MRTLILTFFAGMIVTLAGCLKDNTSSSDCPAITVTAPSGEVTTLKAYLDTNHIVATQDSRGFFYTIDSSASTVSGHPTACSNVGVAYVCKLTNGKTIDSQSVEKPVSFGLYGNIITGWKEALPLMKINSIMNLYLPPSLAYGSAGYQTVPGNAIIMYKDIKLLGFN